MKDFLKNRSKPVFKPSIFGEGLRQLRLLGIVYTAISVVMMTLSFLENFGDGYYQKTYVISGGISGNFDDGIGLLAISSTVFIIAASLYLMRFLRSAKARDFYCSTPHSAGTIWLNFAAAVYAWNLIGLLAAYVLFTLCIMIADVKSFGMCLQMFVGNFTFSLMVFGFTMLAITLTGKLINAIAAIVGLAVTPSVLWAVYHASLIQYFSLFGFLKFPNGITCPDPFFWLLEELGPYYGFGYTYTYSAWPFNTLFDIFCSGQTIFYCLVMGLLYFAAAFLFASIRTGDTAGRPFVNEPAHFIALMSLVVPIVCIGANVICDLILGSINLGHTSEDSIWEFTIVIFFVLGVSWLSELLYSFDLKHSHRALKYLPIPVVIAAILVGIGYAKTEADMTTTVEPREVESFTLVRNRSLDDSLAIFRLQDTYGRTVTEKTRFKDEETIDYVTKQINAFVSLYKESPRRAYDVVVSPYSDDFDYYYGNDDDYHGNDDDVEYINIQLNLKNGKTVTRSVKFDKAHREQMAAAIESDKEYMQKFLALPDADRLNINIGLLGGISASEATDIYKAFVKEYNAMSNEEKLRYLKTNLYNDYDDSVTVDGKEKDESVSDTDIKLVSKSSEVGDYVIDGCEFWTTTDRPGEHTLELSIEGYADGHLYDEKYHFEQTLRFSTKTMPEAHALVVKTCNAKIPELLKMLEEIPKGEKITYVSLTVDYYTDKQDIYVNYDMVNENNNLLFFADNYWEEYEDDYYEDESEYALRKIKTVEVDSNAMVAKLLSDAAATGESVDFTKPYCEVRAYIWRNHRTEICNQYFIQSEFEMMQ